MRNSKINGLRKINSEQSSHILFCSFIYLLLQCSALGSLDLGCAATNMLLISNAHWRLFLFYTTHISFWVYSYISGLVGNWFVTHVYCKPTETWLNTVPARLSWKAFPKVSALTCPAGALLHRMLVRTTIIETITDNHENFLCLSWQRFIYLKQQSHEPSGKVGKLSA